MKHNLKTDTICYCSANVEETVEFLLNFSLWSTKEFQNHPKIGRNVENKKKISFVLVLIFSIIFSQIFCFYFSHQIVILKNIKTKSKQIE